MRLGLGTGLGIWVAVRGSDRVRVRIIKVAVRGRDRAGSRIGIRAYRDKGYDKG